MSARFLGKAYLKSDSIFCDMAEAWASIAVADSCTHVIHWQSICARQGYPASPAKAHGLSSFQFMVDALSELDIFT